MALKYPELFKPLKIGGVTIKNRVVMTPMHLGGRMDSTGNMTEEVIDYYEARAKGGFGLIITGGYASAGGAEVTTTALNAMDNPAAFNSTISKATEKVNAYGTKFFVEVGAPFGRVAFLETLAPVMNCHPVAPSAVPSRWDPSVMCRALTTEECYGLINAQLDSASAAVNAGADGICVGGPYGGYFTDQFATPLFNQRDDEFGFAQGGQFRIATDVIKGLKERYGKDYPVIVRLCVRHMMKDIGVAPLPGEEFKEVGRDVDVSIELAKALEAAGADALLLASGSYDSFYWLYPPTYQKEGLWLEDAKKIKEAVNIPVICPGKILVPEMAEKAIEEGYTDAVALGKACLADAEWANKAKRGDDEDIRPCIGCQNGCMARVFNGGLVTCAVNPALFYEKSDPVTPAAVKKHVVVIGGGVGGCEAAIIAAQRGHEVDLYEKADKLGGLFNLAAVPEFKTGDHRLLAWYAREVRKAGVRVHLNTTVTTADVEKMGADAIIVATGANPKSFSIAGCETVTASDVLAGRDVGKNCVIVGGGLVGCETAVWLARKGVKVTLVEALPMLMSAGAPVPTPNFLMMLDMLPGAGVDVYTGSKFVSWADGKAVIVDAEGKEHSVEAETVVQAVGFTPNEALYNELEQSVTVPVWNIGDSKKPANVMESVRAAWFVAKNI